MESEPFKQERLEFQETQRISFDYGWSRKFKGYHLIMVDQENSKDIIWLWLIKRIQRISFDYGWSRKFNGYHLIMVDKENSKDYGWKRVPSPLSVT